MGFPEKFKSKIYALIRDFHFLLHRRKYELVKIGEISKIISEIKEEVEMLQSYNAGRQIFWVVKSTNKLPGDFAEVGVYQGGTAKLICEAKKGNKPLHLFDTFQEFPTVEEFENAINKKSELDPEISNYLEEFDTEIIKENLANHEKVSLEDVKDYLSEYKNIHFHKGLVPQTLDSVKDKKFSFVHLDVNLYEPTLDCLKFFYPRMNPGGVILTHDYPNLAGVKQAFDEFFEEKSEPLLRVTNNQCLIVTNS